jgi:hypothetical protein
MKKEDEDTGKLSLRMISLQTVDGMVEDGGSPNGKGYHNLVEDDVPRLQSSGKKGKRPQQ